MRNQTSTATIIAAIVAILVAFILGMEVLTEMGYIPRKPPGTYDPVFADRARWTMVIIGIFALVATFDWLWAWIVLGVACAVLGAGPWPILPGGYSYLAGQAGFLTCGLACFGAVVCTLGRA